MLAELDSRLYRSTVLAIEGVVTYITKMTVFEYFVNMKILWMKMKVTGKFLSC